MSRVTRTASRVDNFSCVTFGLMAAALGPMIVLVNSTPDQIPADVIAQELEAAQQQNEEFPEKEKIASSQVREV